MAENNENDNVGSNMASNSNPQTIRRLSQKDDQHLSWHKRVVVHRVPKSDASRSMFKPNSSNNDNNRNNNGCQCIIL